MPDDVYRRSVQQLAESRTVRRVITEMGAARQLAERFVAGESLDSVLKTARRLNASGLSVSLDYLGEAITTREEAIVGREAAMRAVARIAREGLSGNISIKPTQMGLGLDDELCRSNVEQICTVAREHGDGQGEIFVRLDMEAGEYTEATIRLVEELWVAGYRNVGTVVQSYLHRTPDDIRRLNRLGSRVRLVKGAYREPASIAYQDKAEVDRMFIRGMKMLLQDGTYPAIATHDEAMIDATRRFAFEKGIPKDSFEFQMLYGIRRDLQLRLREEGYRVRIYVPYGDAWYPYLMRRLAERPGNLIFLAANLLRESPFRFVLKPRALGAGAAFGSMATLLWRSSRNDRHR